MARTRRAAPAGSAFTFTPEEWPTFIQLDLFETEWARLRLGDDDLNRLQLAILADPEKGDLIVGAGGLRKLRYAPIGRGRGKSGGCRVGYVRFEDHGFILLVTVWGKGEKANLSPADRNAIKGIIEAIHREIKTRPIR